MLTRRKFIFDAARGLMVPIVGQKIVRAQTIIGRPRLALSSSSNGLLNNLESHWKLDEASGSNKSDSKGSNTLVDNGPVDSAAGKLGNCAYFNNGTTDYLTIADNASLSLSTDTAFAWTFWVYVQSFNGHNFDPLIGRAGTGNGTNDEFSIDIRTSGGVSKFTFYVGNGTTFQTVQASTFGNVSTFAWHFVCCWHDPLADTISISIDNGSPDSQPWSGGTQNTASDLYIGRYQTIAWYSNVYIDEINFYKGGFPNSTQRALLYGSGTPPDFSTYTN